MSELLHNSEHPIKLTQLMIAAERGDSNAVNFCLKSGFNVNETMNEKKAVDLAWNNQHFEIVLDLLKANSQYSVDFNVNSATDGIRELVDMTSKLHRLILKEDLTEISKILKNNPNLHHFYSTENISAPAFALMSRKFGAYEFLIANNVYIGPDENVDEIFKTISQSKCKDLKKIHLKYLKNFKDNHLIILALNTAVDQDDQNSNEKLSHVRKAFKFLDEVDPFISLILQIVAASRDFKIIFNFQSSMIQASVVKIDMSQEHVREIKIPAADLLDSKKILNVYGSIARELCIYALEIVYKNFGRPYSSTDDQSRKMFNKISAICEANRGKEELIDSLYVNKSGMYHANVTALIPQMMVKYSKDPVKMDECREKFSELFKFCQEVIEPEMKRKLPSIKSTAEQEAQKFKITNQRQVKLLIALILAIPFTIWLTLLLNKPYIEPLYSCGNLTDELRLKIFESTVDFQGVNVIFGDLFGRNSTSCEHLSPHEVTRMLKVFDSGKFVDNYTGIYENFTTDEDRWINERFQRRLKGFFYDPIRMDNFDQTKYEKVNPHKDDNIYVKYMQQKFRLPSLQVHHKVSIRAKFFVARVLKGPQPNVREGLQTIFGFNTIMKMKFLLLSDKGGSGKSTYFRHMVWKLKRRFPLKWISYVDLKQHIHVLQDVPKTDPNLTTLVDFLSSKILNLTSKVEIEVFRMIFLSNDSIFLWDGVDEVSPMYTDEILRLVEIVKRLTDNRQWLSTRSHLEPKITKMLKIPSLNLEEYDNMDKLEFVEKFLDSEKLSNLNATMAMVEINEFIYRIIERIPVQNNLISIGTNPQILMMICLSYAKTQSLNEFTNLYTIYENFIAKNFEQVVQEKGEAAKEDFFKVTELGLFRRVHQCWAVSQFTRRITRDIYNGQEETRYYDNMEVCKKIKNVNDEKFLRFGIVYIDLYGYILFEHLTFKEFFIAEYFRKNVWENPLPDGRPRDEEVDYRLKLLFYVIHKSLSKGRIISDFINGFIDAYSDPSEVSFDGTIKDLMLNNYPNLLIILGDNFNGINLATRFFKKDSDIINTLWNINRNRTYFHKYFEITPIDVARMTKIVDDNFNQEDRKKITEGKHQAANLLRMSWQKSKNRNGTIAFMNAVNFHFDIDILRNITNFEKFMELLEVQNYSNQELFEFFVASPRTKAVKSINDENVLIKYGKRMLSEQDFYKVTQKWEHGYFY